MAGCAALLSPALVAACAPKAGIGPGQHKTAAAPPVSAPAGVPSPAADCTKAGKATITGKASPGTGGKYAFSPSRLTLQRGGFLAVTNTSDAVHALSSTPDAGIVLSVLEKKERQVIQFPRAGTFTVRSADAKHRAVLRVTVSGESGCGAPTHTLTVGDARGRYSFTPATLSVAAAENFGVVNRSAVTQTVTCTPDPGSNRDNSVLDKGETQILAIDKPGRYTCGSVQHRDAKVTITVGAA